MAADRPDAQSPTPRASRGCPATTHGLAPIPAYPQQNALRISLLFVTRSFAADLARLRSLQVGDPEHWLSEWDAERIFQDWARETWGQENPYCATYQSGGFPCWDVFDKVCVYVCVCVCVRLCVSVSVVSNYVVLRLFF